MNQRTIMTVIALGALFPPVLFLSLGAHNLPDLLTTAALSMFAAAAWVWALDSWRLFPRPGARLTGKTITVQESRVPWLGGLIFAAGLLTLVLSSAADDTVENDLTGRRGWAFGILLVLSPIAVGVAIISVARPTQVLISRDGIRARRLTLGRPMRWDAMKLIQLRTDGDNPTLHIAAPDGRPFNFATDSTSIPGPNWITTLTHYRDHPEDRAEIGTQVSLDRLLNDSAQPPLADPNRER